MTSGPEPSAAIIDERTLAVRDGELADSGSWVYVWTGPDGTIVYVGATGLPPEARTWLHLHAADPEVARIRAEHPEALSGAVEIRSFRLDPSVDRSEVRRAVVALLAGDDPGSPEGAVAAAIVARLRAG